MVAKVGDKMAMGSLILPLEEADAAPAPDAPAAAEAAAAAAASPA